MSIDIPREARQRPREARQRPREARQRAATSLQRYFLKNLDEEIGSLAADALVGFMIEEIGPLIYNKAVTDVQDRLQVRLMEVDTEVYEEEFPYWQKVERTKRAR